MKRLKFSAMDTLFFREARPMESVGGKPLQGRFPPTARTVAGAVRSVIGEAMAVDWDAYRSGNVSQQPVRDIIGAADKEGIGMLDLRGAYPMQGDERLYPAPLHVLHHEGEKKYVRLQPGGAVTCDLGKVYLPEMSLPLPGAKPLEDCWLTAADLVRVLSGGEPEKVIRQKDLFQAEARLGIALDSGTRGAQEGKLYQTVHARVQDEVCIGVDVTGIPADLGIEQVLRLGGEGRFAHVQTGTATMLPPATLNKDAHGLLLMLCSAAEFSGDWLPPGFAVTTDAQGATVWWGTIAGVELTIQCAVLGKSQREGGWDMQKHQSRPAVSLIPAGSVYFCTVNGDIQQAAQQLNGMKIGKDTALGRGELAAGYW